MQVMDPRQANFQETVNLVERNTAPGGYQLVCPEESGKIRSQFDLVELAGEIQTADKFTRATAGSKLSVIAEQVRFLQEQVRIIKRGVSDRHYLGWANMDLRLLSLIEVLFALGLIYTPCYDKPKNPKQLTL